MEELQASERRVLPTDILHKSFRRHPLGGYRQEDVDAFLEEVERSYSQTLQDLSRSQESADDLRRQLDAIQLQKDQLTRAIVVAQETADRLVSEAESRAEQILQRAREEAAALRAQAEAVLREAETRAEAALAQAQEQADGLVRQAEADAQRRLAEVRTEIESLESRMQAEKERLQAEMESELGAVRAEHERVIAAQEERIAALRGFSERIRTEIRAYLQRHLEELAHPLVGALDPTAADPGAVDSDVAEGTREPAADTAGQPLPAAP